MSYIKEKKDSFRQSMNNRDAREVKKLKKTRLEQEGRANIIKAKAKEKERISKAKEINLNDLKRRVMGGGVLKGKTAVPKKNLKPRKTEQLKPRRQFGEGINPAFGLGKDK